VADKKDEDRLIEEANRHGDIHRTDCDEGYLQISQKVLSFIAEAVEAGYEFDYILKGDDDTWFQMDQLAKELEHKPRKLFYWGNMYTNNPRFKDPADTWYEPNYYSDYYPTYATGGTGYVLSVDLAKWIARNKDDLVVFTGNEDAMVGTWCAAHRNVPGIHDNRFLQLYGTDECVDQPLGVHLGPYPVKWPHATIGAAMREYYVNYKVQGTVCDRSRSHTARMVAMRQKQQPGEKLWYRLASFASGHCLTIHGRQVVWRGCSQWDAQQREQEWLLKQEASGWRISPRTALQHCISVKEGGILTTSVAALTRCDNSESQLWSEVPQSTGKPSLLKHHKTQTCVTSKSSASMPILSHCE